MAFLSVKDRYPANWRALALAYKNSTGWTCEQCSVRHGAERRSVEGKVYSVVITVAHVDRYDTLNPDARLIALCQACHLTYDREDNLVRRRANRWRHRLRRLKRGGQLVLFAEDETATSKCQGDVAVSL